MPLRPHKGRGAVSDRDGRFASRPVEFDDEEAARRAAVAPDTVLRAMQAVSIISHNDSPDIPFDQSINPYQGCEHGCVYCYARPSHSYLDLSPGLDFETKIFFKPNASARLLEAWEKPGYECKPITIGANTDPYQPAERELKVTRGLLKLFLEHSHPVNIITKSHLVVRDLDILAELARDRLASVAVSIPTMSDQLKRVMEPRVPSAVARLSALEQLSAAGVPTSVLVAPIIPAINDDEIERILGGWLGFERFLWLDHGDISGDDTDGHIDTLARFANPDTILYATAAEDDPDHAGLTRMAEQLRSFRNADGQRYQLLPLHYYSIYRCEYLPIRPGCYNVSLEKLLHLE